MHSIRVAGIIPESYTDGTGIRYTIFVQGCKHGCYNCQNKETWDFNSGTEIDIDKLMEQIEDNPLLDGITFSGGDPMYQPEQCKELAKLIKKKTNLNIWCYTGFDFEELLDNDKQRDFLNYIDVLVDGAYKEELRSLELRFRGSSNQRIIDVNESLNSGEIVLLDI